MKKKKTKKKKKEKKKEEKKKEKENKERERIFGGNPVLVFHRFSSTISPKENKRRFPTCND